MFLISLYGRGTKQQHHTVPCRRVGMVFTTYFKKLSSLPFGRNLYNTNLWILIVEFNVFVYNQLSHYLGIIQETAKPKEPEKWNLHVNHKKANEKSFQVCWFIAWKMLSSMVFHGWLTELVCISKGPVSDGRCLANVWLSHPVLARNNASKIKNKKNRP